MTAVALAALDVTVVATAMPTIVSELSGVALYGWLISIYLLTSTTSTPLYGQLADNWGRKPILVFGIVLFVAASMLCAQATTMTQLIIFRGVQGLGAGAILPMTMTIIGDLFSVEERARYQGVFSGVWGVSSIVGPALGAVILKFWNWHGIFLINLPVGAAALIMIMKVYHEHNVSKHRYVDVWGALLMMVGVASLMLVLERHSPIAAGHWWPYVLTAVCFGLLIPVEKRAHSPFLPLDLLKKRLIAVAYLSALFGGMVQFGSSAFMPLFVQGAMGGTPIWVGLSMVPVALGWPIGAVMSGKLILKMGYKRVLAIGSAIGVLAIGAMQLLSDTTPLVGVMSIVLFIGLSLGLTSTPLIIAVQNAVEWRQRGTATALNMFNRTIGGAIGVAIMGAVLNSRLSGYLSDSALTAGVKSSELMNNMLDPAKRAMYAPDMLHAVQHDLAKSLHASFVIPAVAAVIALILIVTIFPGGNVAKHSSKK